MVGGTNQNFTKSQGGMQLMSLRKGVYTTCQTLLAGNSNMYDTVIKTMLYFFLLHLII
jgi:hypothetical protein